MVGRKRKVSSTPAPAKISAPRLSEVYQRTALFRALDAARKKRVVWIAAPAGAGKTSVVTTYLAARRLPALWYNVDARDADVAHLFHYVTVAAKMASRRRKLRVPGFAIEHQSGAAAFARGFFEDLYRQRPSRSVMVLDDYHDARSEHFDEVVREALIALPKGMSAIIISRGEPPPLLKSVASQDVTVLGIDDLRLSSRDTTGLIRVYRPDLRGAKLKNALPRILELTNGWAAALTLLLQNQRIAGIDPLAVEEFSERLFDYFATEILDKSAPSEREFLLKTAVVPSLSVAVAARLTESADTDRTLAELAKRSFLIQRLGTSGAYRYHPLLRGFLLRRAESDLGAGPLRELHRRAAEALVEIDQIDEAMEQLEAAEDVALRTRLVLSIAPSYVARGRGRTIEAWIGRLPADWVENNGWLLYWQGVSCVGYAHSRPRALLELAYAHFAREKDVQGLYLSCAAGLRAVVHEGTDFSRLDPWIERFQTLQKSDFSCPPPFEPMLATGMLMASAMRIMDTSYRRQWIERAEIMVAQSEDIGLRIFTGGFLALYMAMFVDLYEAEKIVEVVRVSARATESSALTELTLMQADAVCLWARGDNRACVTKAREALALAARSGVFAWNDFLNGIGSAAALGLDDLPAAREFLTPMAEAAEKRGGWPAGFYHLHVGWEALARGEAALALHCAEQGRLSAETVGPPFGRMVAPFENAQALFALGRRSEGLAALESAAKLAREQGSALVLHACHLVEADCFWEEDRARALAALRQGLELARAHGYHNMYWVSPQLMSRLAVRALEHDIEPDHVRETIARRQLVPDAPPVHLDTWPWRYRLRALGTFEARREVEPSKASDRPPNSREDVLWLKGKPRELLQALVAFGGRGVHEAVLVDALWPDSEGDTGRRVFDTTLHRLRRQLGDDAAVRLHDGGVYLDERVCWVDVWALEDAVARSEKELARGASASELMHVARCLLATYRGPLLAELGAATEWIRRPRERLLASVLRAVERLAAALEQGRAFADARALYDRALQIAPDAEPLRAGLRRCADVSARRSEGPPSERHLN
jgi:LuxR family maltose regulon positive regulatory protein